MWGGGVKEEEEEIIQDVQHTVSLRFEWFFIYF
jgi:hypothetical protein